MANFYMIRDSARFVALGRTETKLEYFATFHSDERRLEILIVNKIAGPVVSEYPCESMDVACDLVELTVGKNAQHDEIETDEELQC